MDNCAPVLFLIFKRPDTTLQVFNTIREARPKHLFIAADGPRKGNDDDFIKCAETRKIVEHVDWECEIKTLYRDENLGCGRAVSEAITWFFNQVEAGIILEDDCLPNQSFFQFTSKMLRLYQNDHQVYHVSGFSWVMEESSDQPYFFMRYPNIWGWATWSNRWQNYQFQLSEISKREIKQCLAGLDLTKEESYFQKMTFTETAKGNVDTWDYQWKFTCLLNQGLCITPNFTMIQNIGNVPGSTRNINLDKALTPKYIDDSKLEKKAPKLELDFEKLHRSIYIWPKARYFYTLHTFKEKMKQLLIKIGFKFKS